MKKLIALAAVLATVAFPSFAFADSIRLDTPSYGGTGCPDGSASVSLSDDQKSLSILFDNFVAEAGGSTNKAMDRKVCNVAIPVHVPNGISVSILAIDYRGFYDVPKNGKATFGVEYFFAGVRGPSFTKNFSGPASSDYTVTNKLGVNALVWSACGADVILRTNPSIRVQTSQNKEATATVDSEDVNASIVYKLQFQKC